MTQLSTHKFFLKNKHEFVFKDTDNFGHILYNIATKFERGNASSETAGHYSMYIKCTQREMNDIINKAVAYKTKILEEDIAKNKNEAIELDIELTNLSTKFANYMELHTVLATGIFPCTMT